MPANPTLKDISDVQARVGTERLLETIQAHLVTDRDARKQSDHAEKRRPLTIRTIYEILSLTFDDADLILPNGYLALGERTAICGMGGVGKSRLVTRLALCCRAGRDFLGWETRGRELRWLFLQ